MITLIATVLNEGDNIHHLMNGLLRQTRQADEIIIVDGGSNDQTIPIMKSYTDRLPLRILIEPGSNISKGRNTAIHAAQGEILAITDAGVRLPDDWLEKISLPLQENPEISVVSGFFQADPQNTFETAMGATVLPLENEIDPESFLPSSRSIALRREAAETVAGYPEWLDYCEDLIFDLRLKATQPPFAFVPDARVYFRPRGNMKSYFLQYYRYARGDGKADLWRKRHAIRYLTYCVAAPIIFWLAFQFHSAFLLLFLIGGIIYLKRPYQRLPNIMKNTPECSMWAWLMILFWIPAIRIVGDIAKMMGYPVGLLWRWQNQPPDWKKI